MKYIFLILIILSFQSVFAQSDIFGKWKTIDDDTNEEKSIVEIYEEDGKAFGKILDLLNPPEDDPDPVCDECTDHRKNKKIRGMQIITSLEQNGDNWSGGEILDPENGKTYRCKIWVEDGVLKVRGYLAFFYRTQTWLPVN